MRDSSKDFIWAGVLWHDHGPEKETFGSYGLLGEFSPHPPDKNFDLACFLIQSPRPDLPSNRNPDRASPVRHEPEPGLFSRLGVSWPLFAAAEPGLLASLSPLRSGRNLGLYLLCLHIPLPGFPPIQRPGRSSQNIRECDFVPRIRECPACPTRN